MRILVSNDDGIDSPGLDALVETMHRFGDVTVVVPAKDTSGASSAITLGRSFQVVEGRKGTFRVSGMPADCTHLAFTGLMPVKPDLVVCGINLGNNLGDDTIYSGTLGAAREGAVFGVDAVSVSLVAKTWDNLPSAVHWTERIVAALLKRPHTAPVFWNVNVPDLPAERIQGLRFTRLGRRAHAKTLVVETDSGFERMVRLGNYGEPKDCAPGTDFAAVSEGFVSVTPLSIDATDVAALQNAPCDEKDF